MNNWGNVLKDALLLYPDLWKEPSRFKAVMLDLLPQDKVTRNLLNISIEEKIPQELEYKISVGNLELGMLCKRLVNACGCSEDIATRVVTMWIYAFDIIQDCDIFEREEENGEEEDVGNIFYNRLMDMLSYAKRRGNTLTISEVKNYLDEFELTVEQIEKVYVFLDNYDIEIWKDED